MGLFNDMSVKRCVMQETVRLVRLKRPCHVSAENIPRRSSVRIRSFLKRVIWNGMTKWIRGSDFISVWRYVGGNSTVESIHARNCVIHRTLLRPFVLDHHRTSNSVLAAKLSSLNSATELPAKIQSQHAPNPVVKSFHAVIAVKIHVTLTPVHPV